MPDHLLSINPFVGFSHIKEVQADLCQQDIDSVKGANGADKVLENDDAVAGMVSPCPIDLTRTDLARFVIDDKGKIVLRSSL